MVCGVVVNVLAHRSEVSLKAGVQFLVKTVKISHRTHVVDALLIIAQ